VIVTPAVPIARDLDRGGERSPAANWRLGCLFPEDVDISVVGSYGYLNNFIEWSTDNGGSFRHRNDIEP